jgi:chromatin segregation and condensation protein Rec8/ScpA/Scc1 (kleisin family)
VSVQTNAPEVAERLRRARTAVRAELAGELSLQAERAESLMKLEAPKGFSTLANSVRKQRQSGTEYLVRPTVDYAKWVVHGRKPGKGLPRFFDAARSGPAVAWLQARLQDARRAVNPKYRRARRGTKRFTAEELELRDRYWMMSRGIKARGIKADDFVKRAAEKVRATFGADMLAALRRGLNGGTGGGTGAGGGS